MFGRRALMVGLVIAMIAGLAVASLILGPADAADQRSADLANGCSDSPTGSSPLDLSNKEATADLPACVGGMRLDSPTDTDSDERLDPSRAAERDYPDSTPADPQRGQAPIRTSESEPDPSAPEPKPDPTPPAPLGVPKSARDPTPRETATRARYSGGGRLPSAAEMPNAETATEALALDMTRLAEPEIWAEYWSREGYTPPAMVKTPVRGKVMSLLSNTQVPGAKVRVFTFFPAGNMLSGPVLPVVMEALTDENGFFEANLPAPERWPDDYPRFALSFEFEGKRIVDCASVANLRGGEHNEIGIFWAPEEPYELAVSAVTAEQGLTVAATGRLDPRRWETRRAKSIFPLFGPQPIATGGSQLVGTWDFTAAPPFVCLLRSGEPVLTRQCARSADEIVRSALDTRSSAVFFENATLDEVIAKFGTDADISIVLADAVDGDSVVSLDIGRLSIRQALDLLADAADLSWRIENGVVIIDEAGKAPPAKPATETGRPFVPVVFPNDGKLALAGTVVDAEGLAISGAQLSVTVNGEPRLAYSDSTGYFEFFGLPDATLNVDATHELYVGRDVELQAGTLDARIDLPFRRPRITLNVVSDVTDAPVTEIWIDGTEVTSPYALSPKGGPLPSRHEQSATGMYIFEHDMRVTFITIQALGLKPRTLEWVDETGTYDVRLKQALDLQRRPRNYDAVQNEGLWSVDEGEGPGLWSLDDDHWVQYSIEFGETPAKFDLILGVTNHTYGTLPLDNEYLFEVDVWLDGQRLGRWSIQSDPSVAQLARIQIGLEDIEDPEGPLLRPITGQHQVRLVWMNDRYIPGQLDANIRYESIRFMEVP